MATMNGTKSDEMGEIWALARSVAGRYGPLALTRAAGEAAAAERKGDTSRSAIWRNVVTHLRETIGAAQAEAV